MKKENLITVTKSPFVCDDVHSPRVCVIKYIRTAWFEDEQPVSRVHQHGQEVTTESLGSLLAFLLQDQKQDVCPTLGRIMHIVYLIWVYLYAIIADPATVFTAISKRNEEQFPIWHIVKDQIPFSDVWKGDKVLRSDKKSIPERTGELTGSHLDTGKTKKPAPGRRNESSED